MQLMMQIGISVINNALGKYARETSAICWSEYSRMAGEWISIFPSGYSALKGRLKIIRA
jgi:hypothetical protein